MRADEVRELACNAETWLNNVQEHDHVVFKFTELTIVEKLLLSIANSQVVIAAALTILADSTGHADGVDLVEPDDDVD